MRCVIAAIIVLVLVNLAPAYPPIVPPLRIPVTGPRVEVGRKLFFDPRLSGTGTIACSSCHHPAFGWADGQQLAVGNLGRLGTRHSPTIINAIYLPRAFWDGRTVGLPDQSVQPLANNLEMAQRVNVAGGLAGQQNLQQVLARLRTIRGYEDAFGSAYGERRPGQSNIDQNRYAHALTSFQSTIISFNAPIDKRLAGNTRALSPAAEIGFGIFQKANCVQCHSPPFYTNFAFINDGTEFATKGGNPTDRGRQAIRNEAGSLRAFKVPTIREIGRTAPYGHDGGFATLERVVAHKNAGGAILVGGRAVKDAAMDPRIVPLELNRAQEAYLVVFLKEAFSSPEYPDISAPSLP